MFSDEEIGVFSRWCRGGSGYLLIWPVGGTCGGI